MCCVCCGVARAADTTVYEFKAASARIEQLCKSIAESLLINVEKKKLYDFSEFEAVQATHHAQVRGRMKGGHAQAASV
jgi:dynein heavy chain, axonemal